MSQNKITFGLEKVHVAFMLDEETPIWDEPIHIPGAVNFSTDPQGGESTFYADNTTYFTHTNNDGYTGDLQMALIPDEVLAEMLGWEIDENGMLVEIADGEQKPFALMFEVKGTKEPPDRVYKCKASRPGKEHATKTDTIDPATETLSLRILPINIDGKMIVKGVMELGETNQAAYNAFFEQVVVPGMIVGGGGEVENRRNRWER